MVLVRYVHWNVNKNKHCLQNKSITQNIFCKYKLIFKSLICFYVNIGQVGFETFRKCYWVWLPRSWRWWFLLQANWDKMTQKHICVCMDWYINTYIDKTNIDRIKLENSTNLVALNDENLKHMAFLKHIEQKIRVETG
jgi:hypothetical protein